MTPAELKRYIHTCYYGHFADHFGDQLLGEAVIHDRLGLDPLGNVGIKTGGATGGSTLWEAAKAVASGYSDCVLAMGWERMDEVPTDEGNFLIACAADRDWESPMGQIYTGYYAVMAQKYWQVFGKAEASFRRTLAEISVKHHGYARFNPFAHGPMKITVDDVLMSPVVADPLRALDCCLMSVGAACAILCDEETAMELTKNTKNKPLRIWVTAGSHTLRPADRRDMEIPLLPNEARRPVQEPGQGIPRWRALSGFHRLPRRAHGGLLRLPHDRHRRPHRGLRRHRAARRLHHQRRADLRGHRHPPLRPRPRLRGVGRLLPHQSRIPASRASCPPTSRAA